MDVLTDDEKRIVEWLRNIQNAHKKLAIQNMKSGKHWIDISNVAVRYAIIADAIERGDHRKD